MVRRLDWFNRNFGCIWLDYQEFNEPLKKFAGVSSCRRCYLIIPFVFGEFRPKRSGEGGCTRAGHARLTRSAGPFVTIIRLRGFANCCLQKKYNMHGWNVQILLPSFCYFARFSCCSASLNYGLKRGSKFSFFKKILLTLIYIYFFFFSFNDNFIERSVTVTFKLMSSWNRYFLISNFQTMMKVPWRRV